MVVTALPNKLECLCGKVYNRNLPYTQDNLIDDTDTVTSFKVEQFVRRYRRGFVNSTIEYLILVHLQKVPLCGYDILTLIYDRFHVLLSPGQLYPVIDQLTKQGVIRKERLGRKSLLRLTSLGESLLKNWKHEQDSLRLQMGDLLAREA